MKHLILVLFVFAMASGAQAKDNLSFKCKSEDKNKKSEVSMKIVGDFEFHSKERQVLDGSHTDVEATFKIDAELNGKNLYNKTRTIDDAIYHKASGDDEGFAETIKGTSKKIAFEFLFTQEGEGVLNIDIDDVTHGYVQLDCKIKS